jgi:hypothetical protein
MDRGLRGEHTILLHHAFVRRRVLHELVLEQLPRPSSGGRRQRGQLGGARERIGRASKDVCVRASSVRDGDGHDGRTRLVQRRDGGRRRRLEREEARVVLHVRDDPLADGGGWRGQRGCERRHRRGTFAHHRVVRERGRRNGGRGRAQYA